MSPKGRKSLPFESLPDPNENGIGVGVGVGVGGVVMGCAPLRSMPEVGYGSLDVSDVEACSETDDDDDDDDEYEYEYDYDAYEPEGFSEALTPAMARRRTTSGNSTLVVDIEACRQLIYVCIILLTMAIIIFGVLVGATNDLPIPVPVPVLDAEAIIG
eukprot:CAMPEP_0172387936 /NCGR_PEP_ID=MMETSP1061-20121228/5123_1 /TAXON_ID=37318 /ORGANISM="Pseudo-nitzschia pungens, Strain cf. pungens" /LENGTH=157 /DNA_ID=CAMNT_0013117689 /DNA_START=620 /DNA_END=1093 /DNA_ORIENTATION=+